jgi:hypothetical protein
MDGLIARQQTFGWRKVRKSMIFIRDAPNVGSTEYECSAEFTIQNVPNRIFGRIVRFSSAR